MARPSASAPLREMRPGEADAVVALVHAAYRGEASRVGWTTEADYLDGGRTDVAEVEAMAADPDGAILVLDDGPGLLACCHVERTEAPGVAGFGLFAVSPRRQGAGTGRLVLDGAAAWCATRWGSRRQRISVLGPRSDLLAWYGRRGFAATGARHPFVADGPRHGLPRVDGLDFVVLERSIASLPVDAPGV